MEAPEPPGVDQPGHDHLDVHVRRMVAQVHQAAGLGAECLRREQRAAPVLDDRRVERRLVHLVLDQQQPVLRQRPVDGRGRVQVPLKGARQMLLARKVAAIADPQGQGVGPECLADADAIDVVRDRLSPHTGIGVCQATVLVGQRLPRPVLKGVGVDGIETEPESRRLLLQPRQILGPVPGEMQRDRWRGTRECVHDGAVFELFEYVARFAGSGEARESGASRPNAPRRDGNPERCDRGSDSVDIDAPAPQRCFQGGVFGIQLGQQRCVRGCNAFAIPRSNVTA